MADQSDVETALVALASAALYPRGVDADSVCGQPCRVYRGWPNPLALDADLAAGRVNVSVFPMDGATRNTTRYGDDWLAAPPPATLTVAVAGNAVTFGGTADPDQLAGIAAGGHSYVYRTQVNDTPPVVAANLAALARADFLVQLVGATLALPGAHDLIGRVVADAASLKQVRRQSQRFSVISWCNDPAVRDTVAAAIDTALASLRFIALPDGTQGRLIYAGGATLDQSQDAALYRRDLLYDVEYATTILAVQPLMLFGTGTVNTTDIIG
jgi:hypothetical protein